MNNALDVLRPHLERNELEHNHTIVIGVVEGDTHDIGKNLVKTMFQTQGFEVIDLGRDVEVNKFVDAAEEHGAEIICMSTLMTTTMRNMRRVVEILEEKGLRDKYKVMIGGGPISQSFADKIGADKYTIDAIEAVKAAKELLNIN